jgi:hypothetical protein
MLTWHVSRAMLPLVGRIAKDVADHHHRLTQLRPELAQLEEYRRELTWPLRSRRYQLEEEIRAVETDYRSAVAELDALGVSVLDPLTGLVGFPTLVNERRAFFSWQPGENELVWWNYAHERTRRAVPDEWMEQPRDARGRKSRSRRK